MIFVVLGTQKFSFDRILKKMDEIAGELGEEIFAQIGHSGYIPKHYRYTKFLDKTEFEKNIEMCSVLITHSGVGTIVSGFDHKKPVVVVPRRKEFGEHVDNHQMQIAEAFSKKNYVIECREMEELLACIEKARVHKFDTYESHQSTVVAVISDYLASLQK